MQTLLEAHSLDLIDLRVRAFLRGGAYDLADDRPASRESVKGAAKEPLKYLMERVDQAVLGEAEIRRRLATHAIPFDALNVGGYANEADEDVRAGMVQRDYQAFLDQRAQVVQKAIGMLWNRERWSP